MPFDNIYQALELANNLCDEPAVGGNGKSEAAHQANVKKAVTDLTDAHTYTRTYIRNGYPRLVEADDQFIRSNQPQISFMNLITQIKEYANGLGRHYPPANRGALETIINTYIVPFANSPTRGVETSETMISIPDLLLRCWNLAQRYAQRVGDTRPLTALLNCLDGNILDQGKCMPGVVARLYPFYARLLRNELEVEANKLFAAPSRMLRFSTPTASAVKENSDHEERELAMALEISAAEARALQQSKQVVPPPVQHRPMTRVNTTTVTEEDLVAQAIALSLQDQQPPPPNQGQMVNQQENLQDQLRKLRGYGKKF